MKLHLWWPEEPTQYYYCPDCTYVSFSLDEDVAHYLKEHSAVLKAKVQAS